MSIVVISRHWGITVGQLTVWHVNTARVRPQLMLVSAFCSSRPRPLPLSEGEEILVRASPPTLHHQGFIYISDRNILSTLLQICRQRPLYLPRVQDPNDKIDIGSWGYGRGWTTKCSRPRRIYLLDSVHKWIRIILKDLNIPTAGNIQKYAAL